MQRWRTESIVLIALTIAVGVLWLTHRAVAPREATREDVLAEARTGGYRIISTEELAARYEEDSSRLLLVDTRQEWEYRAGHIRGALNFPIEPTWWSRWRKAGALAALLGPDKTRVTVFY